jgi:release factor glutamine methyltransferase
MATPTQQAWTIGGLLDWTARYLATKGSDFPRLDAEVLLAHSVNCRRIELYTRHGDPVSDSERAAFRDLVRKRLEGCPVAYLVNRKEFFSLAFEVSPSVLIPRPESEFVVIECLRLAREMPEPQVLDIGTGSGNLAVAVAHQHRGARVTAVDVSPAALTVATRNAERHQVADRIRFLQGNLFDSIPAGETFDFVLSNPPYIAHAEIAHLASGVRDYEPHLALDGGPTGLELFDQLVAGAGTYLKPGGFLILEIGSAQEQPARRRLGSVAGFALAETILDGARHPRVLRARWRPASPVAEIR